MRQNVVETILGAIVLAVAIGFFAWAYGRSDAGRPAGYTLAAQFDRIDGLDVGADVRISGVKVGSVEATFLDPKSYRAEVRFSVRNNIELPKDSSASIVSASLLGGKYISLVPGADDAMLKSGDEITLTQSSINLEELVGKYIFSSGGGGAGSGGATGSSGAGTGSGGAGGGQTHQ